MKSKPGGRDFSTGPSRARRAVYASIVVVVFFGGLEVLLRVFDFGFYLNFNADMLGMPLLEMTSFRRVTNRTVDFDPFLFWKFKPNQVLDAEGVYLKPVRINGQGFRGGEFSGEKPEGVFRIICLGDSGTFGWSVGEDETYANQLGRLLEEKYGRGGFEVLNLGVTGYSSRQGRELFARRAAGFEPDMVVFAFGPNDRLPALKSDADHLRERTWAISRTQVLLNRIQVYKLLKSGVIYAMNRAKGLSLDPSTFIPRLKRKVSQAEFAENAMEVKRLCDEIGAGMIVVNVDYPSEEMDSVTGALEKQAAEAGVGLPADWSFWDSSALVRRISMEIGAPAVDVRALFSDYLELERGGGDETARPGERAPQGGFPKEEPWRFLMVDNGHPNKKGHELIARALLEKIEADPRFISRMEEAGAE